MVPRFEYRGRSSTNDSYNSSAREAISDNAVEVIDRLGYKYYAKALVKIIQTSQSNMCVGIYARFDYPTTMWNSHDLYS